MYKWTMAACGCALILAGCTAKPTVITHSVWPVLPEVPPLPNIDLKPVQFSTPKPDSFVALDYENWLNYRYNSQIFMAREQLYQQRIAEINQQRADWRKLNEQNNDRSRDSTR